MINNKIECAYSKCKKKFTPKSAKQRYCSDVHRVYGNRESNSAANKPIQGDAKEKPHQFDAYCKSIGADSSEVLAWVKVNYPLREAKSVKREKKEMWVQPEMPISNLKGKVSKDLKTPDRKEMWGGEEKSKKEPPKQVVNPRFDRRKAKLGF